MYHLNIFDKILLEKNVEKVLSDLVQTFKHDE
jgi:hypothetical protein